MAGRSESDTRAVFEPALRAERADMFACRMSISRNNTVACHEIPEHLVTAGVATGA